MKTGLSLRADQRLALLGRLRMAEWIEMPEKDFARQVETMEQDPLFKKLFFGTGGRGGVIRRQRWPSGRLSGQFYETAERTAAGSERVKVEEAMEARAGLLAKIRKMGQAAFERYFLHGEDGVSLEEIARKTKTSLKDVRAIHDLLLELGAQSEFFLPGKGQALRSYACLAQISLETGEPTYEFFAPYWARGVYHIRYDQIEDWKQGELLSGAERRRLRHLLRRIETLNLRQNTLFRILESLTRLHEEFLRTRQNDRKMPISLRMLARRLDLAPSTVSRALSSRSIRLPWGLEAPLISLVPGRRNVLREVLARWLEQGATGTDAVLRERLRKEYGIQVSRRTVNAVRNELLRKAA